MKFKIDISVIVLAISSISSVIGIPSAFSFNSSSAFKATSFAASFSNIFPKVSFIEKYPSGNLQGNQANRLFSPLNVALSKSDMTSILRSDGMFASEF